MEPYINHDIVAKEYKRAMRRVATTVTIITTSDQEGTPFGMTATAVSSVSMDPPALLICVNHSASIAKPLQHNGRFCVNVLSAGHEDLVSAFSGRLTGRERFTVGQWNSRPSGDIPFLDGAQCNIFCQIESVMAFGSHSIIVGKVVDVLTKEEIAPLLYADGKLGVAMPLEQAAVPA